VDTFGPKVRELAQSRMAAGAALEKKSGQEYAEKAGKEAGAVTSQSGLVFRSLKPGTGASPKAEDTVKVHYEGRFTDGKVFDSSIKRGEPVEFPLRGVIPCWTEAVQRMKVGEKAEIVCPSSIAYGDNGKPPTIPGGATLVFEVELLDIAHGSPAGAPPVAPPVAPPPPKKH
jgi:FKBP-type peptidyl-prolyl cis-trans isomerase FkpA